MFEEIERSLGTVKEFSDYVRESRRAYGIAWAVWGIIVLAGFALMQTILYRVAWYLIAYIGIIGTLGVAFLVEAMISHRVSKRIGRARSWVDVNCDRIWLLAIAGGICFCFIPTIFITEGVSDPVSLMCAILLGWFIADGFGAGATGILTGSKGMALTGLLAILAVVPLSVWLLEYAFLVFGLIMGGGYAITGFVDYEMWLRESRK
jgi:hypothetical protein